MVAALTLPALVANFKEKEIITKAKKDYSLVLQAFQLVQADYGTPNDNSSLFLSGNSDAVVAELAKYIPGGKLCLSNSKDGLCKDLTYKLLMTRYKNKYSDVTPPAIILPDNGVLYLKVSSNKCVDTVNTSVNLDPDGNIIYNPDGTPSTWTAVKNDCGMLYFDVNGPKKPNKWGYDAFGLQVWSNRIGKSYWDVYGGNSLFSILNGGNLIYNKNKVEN